MGEPGSAVRSQARPSSFASWQQHGRTGECRAQPGPTFLFCELAQHGRTGECRAQPGPTFLFCGSEERKPKHTFVV